MDDKNVIEISAKLTGQTTELESALNRANGAVDKYASTQAAAHDRASKAAAAAAKRHSDAMKVMKDGLTTTMNTMSTWADRALKWEAAIVAMAGAGAIGLLIKGITDLAKTADDLDELNAQLDVTAEKYQVLQGLAEESGIGSDRLAQTIGTIQKKAAEAYDAYADAQIAAMEKKQKAQEEDAKAYSDYSRKMADADETYRNKLRQPLGKDASPDYNARPDRDKAFARAEEDYNEAHYRIWDAANAPAAKNPTMDAWGKIGVTPEQVKEIGQGTGFGDPDNLIYMTRNKVDPIKSPGEQISILKNVGDKYTRRLLAMPAGEELEKAKARIQGLGIVPQADIDVAKAASDRWKSIRRGANAQWASAATPVYTDLINPALDAAENFLTTRGKATTGNMRQGFESMIKSAIGAAGTGKGTMGEQIEGLSKRFADWAEKDSGAFFEQAKKDLHSIAEVARFLLNHWKLVLGVELGAKYLPATVAGGQMLATIGKWLFGLGGAGAATAGATLLGAPLLPALGMGVLAGGTIGAGAYLGRHAQPLGYDPSMVYSPSSGTSSGSGFARAGGADTGAFPSSGATRAWNPYAFSWDTMKGFSRPGGVATTAGGASANLDKSSLTLAQVASTLKVVLEGVLKDQNVLRALHDSVPGMINDLAPLATGSTALGHSGIFAWRAVT